MSNTQTTPEKLAAYAEHLSYACMGSTSFTKHPFAKLVYTSGAGFVAETFGSYWLIDLIASHQATILRKLAKLGERDFQVWTLHLEGEDVVAEAWSDTPGAEGSVRLARQVVGYSDFPVELFPFTDLWVENGTLLLKAER